MIKEEDIEMGLRLYTDLAARTANPEAHRWEHYVLGLGDELGEIQKIFKKLVAYGSDGQDIDHLILNDLKVRGELIEELGDLTWFFSQLCRLYEIDPDEVLAANIRKLRTRYPEKFDPLGVSTKHGRPQRQIVGEDS